jgi:DNA-binding CsgD family transcriptional regulator
VIAQARALGLRGVETFVHGLRGEVAWRRGRWIEARAEALFEVHFNEDEREVSGGSFAHATLARVEAATGRIAESTRHADLAVDRGARIGMGVLEAWGRHARGLAALAAGEARAAVGDLEWIWDLCQQGEIGEPGPLWWHGDLLEAFWRADRADDGRRLIEYSRQRFDATGSHWAAAMTERGLGLLDRDAGALLRSARRLDAIGAPFEAARSRALMGEVVPLSLCEPEVTAAFDMFAALGARPWAERAAVMLGRRGPSAGPLDLLTRAEMRVAAAVARGLSNREAADSLFLSPKTVDAHLQRIYPKLGVRSRTELALLIGASRIGAV